jgi:hypothetical protein
MYNRARFAGAMIVAWRFVAIFWFVRWFYSTHAGYGTAAICEPTAILRWGRGRLLLNLRRRFAGQSIFSTLL